MKMPEHLQYLSTRISMLGLAMREEEVQPTIYNSKRSDNRSGENVPELFEASKKEIFLIHDR